MVARGTTGRFAARDDGRSTDAGVLIDPGRWEVHLTCACSAGPPGHARPGGPRQPGRDRHRAGREGYQMLRCLARPVAWLLPADRVLGLVAEDDLGRGDRHGLPDRGPLRGTRHACSATWEPPALYRVPGYPGARGGRQLPGLGGSRGRSPRWWRPTTAGRSPCWSSEGLLGFCTVFLPDSPTPTSGSVRPSTPRSPRRPDARPAGLLDLVRVGKALAGRALADWGVGAGTRTSRTGRNRSDRRSP